MNIFIYYKHMEEEFDRQTKREGWSEGEGFTFSVGPNICNTYQVCGVHMACKNIHFMGQPSMIGPHIEAELEGYIVLHSLWVQLYMIPIKSVVSTWSAKLSIGWDNHQ